MMKSTLDYFNGHLCILNESEPSPNSLAGTREAIREWYSVRETAEAEVATLVGRPVARVESGEGLYLDEEGNVYQLADRGKTKPIAVKTLPASTRSEIEVLLEASLKEGKAHEKN